MQKEITLNFYDNECHGYLEISKNDLKRIGIYLKKFLSDFSFYSRKTNSFYFEEDLDAMRIIKAIKELNYKINFKNKFVNHLYFENSNFVRTTDRNWDYIINNASKSDES